jgi:hypothetical protein
MPVKNKSCSFLLLLLLIACSEGGGGYDGSSRGEPSQPEQEIEAQDFSTRLNDQLLISGDNCDGGETIEIGGRELVCSSNQWLITIDNVNTCSPSGDCTESEVDSMIGEVRQAEDTNPDYIFYEIIPVTEITLEQQNILNQVQVRSDVSGENAIAIFK